MDLEGNISAVIEALQLKKQLIENNEFESGPRILFIGCGGVMYGCEGGGTVTALHDMGYGEVFDFMFGVSTGAPGIVYFLSEKPRVGTSIYYEECCSSQFLNPWRWYKPVDTDFLDHVFRGATSKGFVPNRVLSHRSTLLIGMTDAITGKQHIVRPATSEELYQCVHASIRIPGLAGKPLEVMGRSFTDGAMSNPLLIRQLVKEFAPTHVLVLPHRTSAVTENIPLFETALNSVFYRSRISNGLRQAIYNRKRVLLQELQWLRDESSLPYIIAWSGGAIRQFERDAEKTKEAAFAAEMFWRKLLR